MNEFVDRQYSTVFSKHKMEHETKEIWKTQEDLIWLRYSENNENKKKGRFLQRKKFDKKEFRAIITYAQNFRFFLSKKKKGRKNHLVGPFFMIEKLNKFSHGWFGYRSFLTYCPMVSLLYRSPNDPVPPEFTRTHSRAYKE